jgi:outer membrane protein OmpA-like peptidoglycan-associated protein
MINLSKSLGLSALALAGVMGASAFAQTASAPAKQPDASAASQTTPGSPDPARPSSMNPDDTASYATGKPLDQNQSKEGFWGRVNPFARKKWVRREVDPIKDRTNELDQLQAKNANDIREVDQRSQAGIGKAISAANAADAHAAEASGKAGAAQSTATDASNRTDSLNGTVSNLDQYQQVSATSVPFAAGRTVLGPQGKATLDEMAGKLSGEKGFIIEVQGYSKAGVQTSQAMADSVVRYLVTEHQVPLYRIYRTGMGKQVNSAEGDGQEAIVNGVRVTLLHNSLATMGGPSASNTPPTSIPSQTGRPAFGVSQ